MQNLKEINHKKKRDDLYLHYLQTAERLWSLGYILNACDIIRLYQGKKEYIKTIGECTRLQDENTLIKISRLQKMWCYA